MTNPETFAIAAVILAAGKGKRMKSDLPKVLHKIEGKPLAAILLDTLRTMCFDQMVVIIGHKGELVQEALTDYPVEFAWQREQLGTAHAVSMARAQLGDFDGMTLVCNGDVPFLSDGSIRDLITAHQRTGAAATCLTAILEDPTGYGRIIREDDSDLMTGIVEQKDASKDQLQIREINTGTFCFDNQKLFGVIDEINDDNAQGEFYLTDAVRLLHESGHRVAAQICREPDEVRGVNDLVQLEYLAKRFAARL